MLLMSVGLFKEDVKSGVSSLVGRPEISYRSTFFTEKYIPTVILTAK